MDNIESIDIMGQYILVAKTKDDANAYCKAHPKEKHLIWLESEVWDHMLDSPEELQQVIDAKKLKPGVKCAFQRNHGNTV